MSVYKMYGLSTGGTEDSVASLDIQFDGVITAIHGALYGDLDADTEAAAVEVSFLSSNTFATNDARGSLITLGSKMSLTTSGVAMHAVNSGVSNLNIPVTGGERVHLHFSCSASVVVNAQMYIYVDDAAPASLRRRR